MENIMHFSKIKGHEQRFIDELVDSNGTKYTEEIISDRGFVFNRIRPIGFDNYYVKEETEKNMIVVHITEGYLKGDLATLVKPGDKVCVNYVIARNGTVYEIIDQKYWGWHLGKGAIGGNGHGSSRSISIELSNAGVLNLNGNELHDYKREYCSLNDKDEYIKLDVPFRGEKYFASVPDEQYNALAGLIEYVCKEHNIPKKLVEDKYNIFPNPTAAKQFRGICTHINFRNSGKWDIGPAFDWDKVLGASYRAPKVPEKVAEEPKVDVVVVEEPVVEKVVEELKPEVVVVDEAVEEIVIDEPVEISPTVEPIVEEIEPPIITQKKRRKPVGGLLGAILKLISDLLGRNSL